MFYFNFFFLHFLLNLIILSHFYYFFLISNCYRDVDDPYYDLGFIEDLENCCLKNNHHNFQPSSSNSSKLNQSINGNSFNRKKDSNWCLNKTPSNDVTILTTHQRTIYTAGRPPWYDAQGQSFEPFVIGEFVTFFLFSLLYYLIV